MQWFTFKKFAPVTHGSFLVSVLLSRETASAYMYLLRILWQDSCTIDMRLESIIFIMSTPVVTVH